MVKNVEYTALEWEPPIIQYSAYTNIVSQAL